MQTQSEAEEDLESPEFLERLRRGEEAAFRQLIAGFQDKIYNLAMRLTRNSDEAEEVLQETLLAVFDKVSGFEGRSRLSTWIYAIASNGALSRLRKKANNSVTFDEDVLLNAEKPWSRNHNVLFTVPEDRDPLIREELQGRLEQAIEELPDGYRELFIMKELQKMPVKEIAGIYGIKEGAVKTRLHRARLLLRAKLSDYWVQEP